MQNYEKVTMKLKNIIINNFLGGISWGLGATIGLTIVLALLTIVLRWINLVPFIGDFIAEIMKFVAQKNPNLIK